MRRGCHTLVAHGPFICCRHYFGGSPIVPFIVQTKHIDILVIGIEHVNGVRPIPFECNRANGEVEHWLFLPELDIAWLTQYAIH